MPTLLTVSIPATSANLGPGFDCMGIALDLWNTFELHSTAPDQPMQVENFGEGAQRLPTDASHMVAATMIDEARKGGKEAIDARRGYKIVCRNAVPTGSGLGSSSTAVLAGLIFANAVRPHADGDAPGASADGESTLARACAIEGHGDNVAPAMLGGLVLVASHNTKFVTRRIALPNIKVCVCVPDFNFLTSQARAALPTTYSRADAVFNIGHALLVAEAMRAGNLSLLAKVMEDRVHETYRLPLIPGAEDAKRAALDAGAAAVALSGAGPGLIAFADGAHEDIGLAMQRAFREAGLTARFWVLNVVNSGLRMG